MLEKGKTFSTIGKPLETIIEVSKSRWELQKDYPVYNPGNNPLMLLNDEKSELKISGVYNHIDPESGEVVYIGKGPLCRAYEMFIRRDHAHAIWFLEKINNKHSLFDVVKIKETGLTDKESRSKEDNEIKEFEVKFKRKPKFNK